MNCRELQRSGRSRGRPSKPKEPIPSVIAPPPPPPPSLPRGWQPKSRDPTDLPPPPTTKATPTSTTFMSSTSTPDKPIHDSNKNKSSDATKSNFQKTVCLADWWLVKAELDSEGKRLAVAGLTSREQQAMRVFSSAPILKRYDVFTLETTDGICVIIKGFMNKARTVENGFPSEVCNHFIFGFPPYWEEYAEKCMAEESPSKNVSEHNPVLIKLSPQPETVAGTGNSRNNISKQHEKFIGEEAHVDSLNRDFRLTLTSKGDKMEIKSILKSTERKYSAACSPQKPNSGTDDNLVGLDSSSGSGIAPGCQENKSSSRDHPTENPKTLEISGNCLDQQLSNMVEFARGMSSSEGILSHSEAGGSTSSMKKLEKKPEDCQMSARTLGYGNIRLNSASLVGSDKAGHPVANVNCELVGRTDLQFAAAGLKVSADDTNSSELDADSVDKSGHKSMDKESLSEDTLQRNLVLQKLSPRSEMVGEEARVDSHRRDLGSIQDKMDFEGMLESTETESLTVLSPQTSNRTVRGAENKLHVIDTSSALPIASRGPEKESSFRDCVIENPRTLEMSENCLGNRIKALAPSVLGWKITVSNEIDKDGNSSGKHENMDNYTSKTIEDHTERNPLSACHLHKKSRCKNAFDNQKRVKLDEQLSDKTSFGKDISSSEEVLNHTEGRALTRSMRKLERKWKDDQISARISEDREISSESVSLVGFGKVESAIVNADGKSGARNGLNFTASGCKEPTDAINSKSYVDSVKPKFDQKAKPSLQDKDCRSFIIKDSSKMGKNRAKSSTRSATDNRRKNNAVTAVASLNNISENAKASVTEAKRKVTYETPEKEKKKVSVDSPQSFSFNRSRSGRLLMPALEFWRNQRAIYDADRTITGIGEGLRLGQPTRGCRSERQ
ncbi:uncharacterized protein Fot_36713 [Forsythia ovata]|uniref:SANTA domain-containing protein n=1 Tax=Forsythia ovata TaxID=205694 RepID=A0ABD1SQ74_9LAMI